jgi:hypothetical protein
VVGTTSFQGQTCKETYDTCSVAFNKTSNNQKFAEYCNFDSIGMLTKVSYLLMKEPGENFYSLLNNTILNYCDLKDPEFTSCDNNNLESFRNNVTDQDVEKAKSSIEELLNEEYYFNTLQSIKASMTGTIDGVESAVSKELSDLYDTDEFTNFDADEKVDAIEEVLLDNKLHIGDSIVDFKETAKQMDYLMDCKVKAMSILTEIMEDQIDVCLTEIVNKISQMCKPNDNTDQTTLNCCCNGVGLVSSSNYNDLECSFDSCNSAESFINKVEVVTQILIIKFNQLIKRNKTINLSIKTYSKSTWLTIV